MPIYVNIPMIVDIRIALVAFELIRDLIVSLGLEKN